MTDAIMRAAEARAAGVTQRSHRPTQRRSSQEEGPNAGRVAFRADMQLRDGTTDSGLLHFTGYASTYEQPYEMYDFFGPYAEVVSAGAATDSLNRADLDVPLVLQHDSLRRIARTTNGSLTLSQDDHGLRVDAPSLDPADGDVAYIAPKLRAGLIDEMSFMFRITAGRWSPDYTEFRITQFDIHRGDVAIVGYGANPSTSGALRSAPSLARQRVTLFLAEVR